MKKRLCSTFIACAILPFTVGAYDHPSKNPELAVVKAFYELLSNHDDTTLATRAAAVITPNWIDQPPPLVGGQGINGLVQTFGLYHQLIPNMKWTPKSILQSGHTYTVRSIGEGTPAVDFLKVGAISGKHFKIMSIDIHTVKKGKIIKTYHVEDWQTAIRQLTTP